MEQSKENADLEERRKNVASFIQACINLREGFIEEVSAEDFDPEIYVEAQDFEVREYQLDAWGALWEARNSGANTGLIHLATGLGKTSVAVFDVIKYRQEYSGKRKYGPRILFASHKNEINEQAAERFSSFIPDATQGFFNGEEKDIDQDITFATLQSLNSSLDTFKQGYFDYIIYDEAHHGKAETFEAVIKHFKPKFQLALTATPNRLDRLNIRELFGQELYSKSLAEALAEGLLADPDYHIVFDDAVKEAMESGFEASSLRALTELFKVKPRNEVIANNIREEMKKIGLEFGSVKTIVFCQNIEHAAEIAELLGGKPYHSGIKDKKQKEDTLNDFRYRDLQIITTRDMFNEGVDIPDARLLVFLRSTESPTIFEQQLGRGLRKHAGKDRVSVLDFMANAERIVMIRDLAEAIRTRRTEIGEKDGTILDGDNVIINVSNSDIDIGDLIIHTNHGDFEFDKLVVNLLEKYESLLSIEYSPDDYVSISDASKITGLSKPTILKIAADNEWELPRYRFDNGYISDAINQEQLTHIIGLAIAYTPVAQEGVVSLLSFAKTHNAARSTVERLVDEQNIDALKYKFGGVITRGLTKSQQDFLEGLVELSPTPKDEIKSVNAFAKEIGMAFTTLKVILEANEIELPDYKFGPKISGGLDADMQDTVRNLPQVRLLLDTPLAPTGVLSIKAFANSVGIDKGNIAKIIDKEGIELPVYRFGSMITGGITPRIRHRLNRILNKKP